MKSHNQQIFLSALTLLAATPSLQATEKNKPNILFIEVDDLNYEYLSSFGSSLVSTPNIDRLAKTGVRFENAVCQGMMSGPSRNSLMTGLYPHNLGFYNNGELKSLPEGIWTFPRGLQASGYYTAWIGKCHIRPFGKDKTEAMREQMGFDFVKQTEGRVVISRKASAEAYNNEEDPDASPDEAYENNSSLKKANRDNNQREGSKDKKANSDWYLSFLAESGYLEQFLEEYPDISTLPEDVYLDGFFTHNAIDFLDGYSGDKPFFLWLNYSVPHEPYDVAREYHDPFKPEDMPGSTLPDFKAPDALLKKTKWSADEEFHKKEQAGHCAAVTFLDRQVGRVIEALISNGQLENTVIFFFSDQGVMLGDHQRNMKGTLFRQITNPALIISFPSEFMSGKVITTPIELTDLINTTFDIAGREPSVMNQCRNSNSLVPVLRGKKQSVRKYAFGEIDGYVMVTDGRYRLISGKDISLLFDDRNDPKNLHDLAEVRPRKVRRLTRAIDAWLTEKGPVLPRNSM